MDLQYKWFDTDVNAAENDSTPPLYMATQLGRAEAVSMLLEARADVNAAKTMLYVAAQLGRAEVARMLLEAKADVNAAKNNGVTLLCIAACNEHTEAVAMLG
jgi:ankyrin repeat protein